MGINLKDGRNIKFDQANDGSLIRESRFSMLANKHGNRSDSFLVWLTQILDPKVASIK